MTPGQRNCGPIPTLTPERQAHTHCMPSAAMIPGKRHCSPIPAVTAEWQAQMHCTPSAAMTPGHHTGRSFTPPRTPSRSLRLHTMELEEDVKEALSLGSASLLSWALRPYGCSCSIDHSVHAAINYQQLEALELFLTCGTMNDCLHVACGGQMPLHKAISRTITDGDIGCMMSKMLLAHGAQVNAIDAEGQTPIHYASRVRSLPAVQLLLQHGADVNLVTSSGFTPLHSFCQGVCFEAEHLSILEALLAHGAEPARRDAEGLRPYDHINMQDIFETVDPLKPVISGMLVKAQQQWILVERWCSRRSCLFLRRRPESGHIVCLLSEELFRAVMKFL